ncbi:RNA-binding protein 5-like protein [Dinothrombium tinctorium]|uniref:RNA-binding protein 5-like protein n=1 Tax=Dinothrombium tinctorium TaxID=1965070 RepID=A0A443QUV6_9ACAR|nr:RNA-binding protein 5-like protein [Dinothrombium tinctorium]
MGGSRERERERSKSDRERRYRESRHKEHFGKERRSPDYYSSEDESYDESRRNRSRERSSWRNRRDRSRSRDRDKERLHSSKYSDCNDDSEYFDHEFDRDRNSHSKREETPNNTLMIRGLASHISENDGLVTFDQCQATLHYSIPKDAFGSDRGLIQKYDWTCYKCGVNNFKRREQCFKCGTPREESASNERGDEISATPTNCLLLHNLSPHTTEERILTVLGTITALPIKSIRIPRDSVYGLSRGICFVELHTTLEASQLFTLLSSLNPGFIVDDYPLTVSYAKRNMPSTHMNACAVNAASVALAAAQWTNQTDNQISASSEAYSNTTQTIVAAQSDQHKSLNQLGTVVVNGVAYQKYPPPDTSKYQYDSTSGYYYDPTTGLYYDSKSHYYYNPTTQTYLYWNSEYETYLPPDPDSSSVKESGLLKAAAEKNEKAKDKSKEKQDKVKIAKKIAKDMEKWAKTLNQKKESGKLVSIGHTNANSSSTNEQVAINSFADTSNDSVNEALNICEKKAERKEKSYFEGLNEEQCAESNDSSRNSPSQDAASIIEAEQLRLTDWTKLLCLLCKRQFNSREQLIKHQQLSDLHKANYRDRAKERRMKYGIPETPEPNKLRDKFLRDEEQEQSIPAPIAEDNIGNKMLKAMGWTEGQGLGRSNQGRANIIEVERRSGCAGLGIRTTQGAGESYKDAVRRAMQQRFKELSEKE